MRRVHPALYMPGVAENWKLDGGHQLTGASLRFPELAFTEKKDRTIWLYGYFW